MNRFWAFVKANKLIFSYSVCLLLFPLLVGGTITYSIKEYYYFFQDLHWIDRGIVFCFLSLTMAFALTPTTFICFFSGFIWGWISLAYIVPAYLVAQTIGYYFARLVDGNRLYQSLDEMGKIPDFLKNEGASKFQLVFLSRLSPVLPFSLMNMVLSVLKIDIKIFTIAGILGMLPRSILVIWLGTQALDLSQNLTQNLWYKISLVLLTIASIVGIGFVMRKRNTN